MKTSVIGAPPGILAHVSELPSLRPVETVRLRLAATIPAHEPRRHPPAAQPAIARPPDAGAAGPISGAGADPCAGPPLDAADAAARRRQLLDRPPAARRPACPRARGEERGAGRLDLAAGGNRGRRAATELPRAARPLPRT